MGKFIFECHFVVFATACSPQGQRSPQNISSIDSAYFFIYSLFMTKKSTVPSNQLADVLALLTSLLYMQSVLTVAHHTGMWAHDGSSYTVGPPAIPALVIGLLLSGYAWYKKKGTPSVLVIIALTVLATSSLFWLSGLRVNFFS